MTFLPTSKQNLLLKMAAVLLMALFVQIPGAKQAGAQTESTVPRSAFRVIKTYVPANLQSTVLRVLQETGVASLPPSILGGIILEAAVSIGRRETEGGSYWNSSLFRSALRTSSNRREFFRTLREQIEEYKSRQISSIVTAVETIFSGGTGDGGDGN